MIDENRPNIELVVMIWSTLILLMTQKHKSP